MTAPAATRKGGPSEPAPNGASASVPVRRSRWASFWVGVAAAFLSLLAAAALSALLLLSPAPMDGALVVFTFGALWFSLFFLSLPLQRRYARSLDERHPGARLAGGRLCVPLADGAESCFDLGRPLELTFGWLEIVTMSTAGPTTNVRGLLTYAILSQAGRELFLQAEDSVREARAAGWPNRTNPTTPDLRVRLWASDLVTLVEAVRSHALPPAALPPTDMPQPNMPPTDNTAAREELIREWPVNPLPARNRHEVSLFLEWMKVELISRTPKGAGEECVGRIRGADPAAAPDTYRLVFSLLEADPEDENDFGSGVSQIFDPSELLLLLSRMEREGTFGPGGRDANSDAAHVLTHRTTREVNSLRRAQGRGVGLIEQLMRFPRAEGRLAEESIKGSAQRSWFRGTAARFDVSALEARRNALGESIRLLQMPAVPHTGEGRQAALVREMRGRCAEYLSELGRAGFEDEHLLHPLFSHAHHLSRFAARALRAGKPDAARAAFAAWAAAEPSPSLFPTREFADAVFELKVEPTAAATLVPTTQQHAFSSYYDALLDPDYNPWSY